MHLTLRQLQYFSAIIETGNITRAAERLHVAPTALSQQIKAMEENLGLSLLDRHSRGVAPTGDGAELFERAREILGLVGDIERRLSGPRDEPARSLQLGLLRGAARLMAVDVLFGGDAGRDSLPLQIAVGNSTQLMRRLRSGELDFIYIRNFVPEPGLRAMEVLEERLVFITAPGQARPDRRISFADALRCEIVTQGDTDLSRALILDTAARAGLPPPRDRSVTSIDILRHVVMRGLGAGFVPFGTIEEESRRGDIAVHEIDGVSLTLRNWLVASEASFAAAEASGLTRRLAAMIVAAHLRVGPYYRDLTTG